MRAPRAVHRPDHPGRVHRDLLPARRRRRSAGPGPHGEPLAASSARPCPRERPQAVCRLDHGSVAVPRGATLGRPSVVRGGQWRSDQGQSTGQLGAKRPVRLYAASPPAGASARRPALSIDRVPALHVQDSGGRGRARRALAGSQEGRVRHPHRRWQGRALWNLGRFRFGTREPTAHHTRLDLIVRAGSRETPCKAVRGSDHRRSWRSPRGSAKRIGCWRRPGRRTTAKRMFAASVG